MCVQDENTVPACSYVAEFSHETKYAGWVRLPYNYFCPGTGQQALTPGVRLHPGGVSDAAACSRRTIFECGGRRTRGDHAH